MIQYGVECKAAEPGMRTLTDWLGEATELTDRIANHLTNIGALPPIPPEPAATRLQAEEVSIFNTAESLVIRLQAIERALSNTAYALGGRLGGQR